MLTILHCFKSFLNKEDGRNLRIATWFHDAVYDPTRKDNEEQSAELARVYCKGRGIDPTEIIRLILLTKDHKVESGDIWGGLFSDLDMLYFLWPRSIYSLWVKDIREEYSHLSDEEWTKGRAKFLRELLEEPIYYTEYYYDQEKIARDNIQWELDQLTQKFDATPEEIDSWCTNYLQDIGENKENER